LLYPPWYKEGFAEFLSTVTVHEDGQHVVIGAFPTDRKQGFRLGEPAPYEEIISARVGSSIHGTMFYEQSWSLVHWIQLGRGSGHSPAGEMNRYLEWVEAGHSDAEAFEEAFGISMKELRRQLITYLNGNYHAVAVPLATFGHKSVAPRVTAMAQDEISVDLGQLALVRHNDPLAQNLFTAALSSNPLNARAHAGLGDALAARELWEEAEPHYLRALEIDAENADIELDYAEYLHDKALRNDAEAERKALLRDARKHYVRSYRLDSGIPETYAMYGKSFLAPGEDPTRSVEMLEHAHSLLPANPIILRLLAKAYVVTGREDEARPLVERIVANSHEDDRVAKVDEILASIAESNDEDEDDN
jgi:tetratricopeptide (TPR) repeat protein